MIIFVYRHKSYFFMTFDIQRKIAKRMNKVDNEKHS